MPTKSRTKPTNAATRGSHAREAALAADTRNSTRLSLPFVGTINLPPADQLAFLGGVTALAAIEIIDWPVALVLAVGHSLVNDRNSRLVRDFGEALEEA